MKNKELKDIKAVKREKKKRLKMAVHGRSFKRFVTEHLEAAEEKNEKTAKGRVA